MGAIPSPPPGLCQSERGVPGGGYRRPHGRGYNLSMRVMTYMLVFMAPFTAALVGTGAVALFLRARAILDRPNERSSHKDPTPRGGGIAIMAGVAPTWLAIAFAAGGRPAGIVAVVGCALALAVVSWIDDLGDLHPAWRLAIQFAAAALALTALPASGLVFQGLFPFALDRAAAVLAWVWFVNLFNFMDGIDGITGVETAAVGFGLFLIAVGFPEAAPGNGFSYYALAVAAAGAGFLWWNWEPAKIFMGDVGSVPLGFMLGFLLLWLAAAGQWAAALILPLYYVTDTGITLLARLARGERIWRAHASHFYQRAARGLASHARVVRAILVADIVLVVLAVVAAAGPVRPALAGAGAAVALLLVYLGRAGAKARPAA